MNYARKITRLGLHIGRSPGRQFRDLRHAPARLLWAMAFPVGVADYARDRLRGRSTPVADPDIPAWGPAAAPENPVFNPALRLGHASGRIPGGGMEARIPENQVSSARPRRFR